MRCPGVGDPKKRRKTIRFLIILLIVGVIVGVSSSVLQGFVGQSDPLKVCINNRDTPYKISATLELYVDGNKAAIPANIGFGEKESDDLLKSDCQRSLYTLTAEAPFMQNGRRNTHLRLATFSGFGPTIMRVDFLRKICLMKNHEF